MVAAGANQIPEACKHVSSSHAGDGITAGVGTKGVTTPTLASGARADANAGLATVDDVCLATRLYERGPGVKSLACLMSDP